MHHQKADIDRLYLPRSEGGRGLIQIELTYTVTTVGLETYLKESKDAMMKLILENEKKKRLYSVVNEAVKVFQELGIDRTELKETDSVIKKAKKANDQVKERGKQQMRIRWEQKPLHGQFL